MDELTKDIRNFIRRVASGEENAIEVTEQLTDDGAKHVVLALQNRKINAEAPAAPIRLESPRRCHVFYEAGSLAVYLDKYKTDNTVVMADPQERTIYATLDEKAVDGFEVLVLRPQVHPLFAPWQAVIGKTVRMTDFAEFIMRNRRSIANPNGKALALTFSQITAAISVTVHRGRGTKVLNGVLVKTEIQGQETTDPVELPDELTLEVPLYVGTKAMPLTCDLLLSTATDDDGEHEVVVNVTSSELEEARVKSFEEMMQALSKVQGIILGWGSPQTAAWDYRK